MEGTVPTEDKYFILNMFKIPINNQLILCRLDYNITKLLVSDNNVIRYQYPINTDK